MFKGSSLSVVIIGSAWATLVCSLACAGQNMNSGEARSQGSVSSMLITAFEPFAGSVHNKSAQTADILKRSLMRDLPQLHVEVCILPVEYDRATDELFKYLKKMNPPAQRILGLGEKTTSTLRLETQAANWDDEKKGSDAAGNWRQGQVIVPGAPQVLRFSGFPVQAMMDRIVPADRNKIVRSTDMDNFVCNNTAYRTELRLKGQLPFLFIHVPDGYSPNNDPQQSARLILELAPWL
jgi:pyrrolidone-carboxylate peptidase